MVAYNMSEWRTFRALLKGLKSDMLVLVTTFLLTVIFDLTIAIELGLVLAVVLFVKRMSESSQISIFNEEVEEAEYVEGNIESGMLQLPKGVEVYEIEGPFFFGLANKFEETMKKIGSSPDVRIIRMRKVPFIDSTGLNNLSNLIRMSKKDKTVIVLSGVNKQVRNAIKKANIDKRIGDENICNNITEALARAEEIIAKNKK